MQGVCMKRVERGDKIGDTIRYLPRNINDIPGAV
jgi:hypothetical protein